MLKINTLQSEIQSALEDLLPNAFREGMKATFPRETKAGNEVADKFADTITQLLAEPLAKALAGAIDYHVKSASIYGPILTMGGPTTQTAMINSPSPLTNGKIPNSLGIM